MVPSDKLEVSFTNGRGKVLLNGQKIEMCCGIDLSVRPQKSVQASIAVTVVALSAAVEPSMIEVRQKELDSAIDEIHNLLMLPDSVSPTEMLERLNHSLLAIRAGLRSAILAEPKT
jgi:hypothetical protein